MSQGELPSNAPEEITEAVDETIPDIAAATPAETTEIPPTKPLDFYALNRQFERDFLMGRSIDEPRPDQRGTSDTYERLPSDSPLPAGWNKRGHHFMTIVYATDENGHINGIEYLRPGDPGF